jgi:enamine deaminase RidA (YjgF/YER057c/UK114 family)
MGRMTLECIDPDDLPTPSTYTHVVVATGSRLVFVAGQEPEDEHGNLVGVGDLAVQARQVFANVGRALDAAGALPGDVTKITIFVVGYRRVRSSSRRFARGRTLRTTRRCPCRCLTRTPSRCAR